MMETREIQWVTKSFHPLYTKEQPPFRVYVDDSVENQNIRKRDNDRIEALIKNGYKIMVVWEADFEENPFETYEKCVDFLKN